MIERKQVIRLITFSILLIGIVGCARPATEPAPPPTPTVPAGYETHTASTEQGQCGYAISYPSDMNVSSQGMYSWLLNRASTDPSGPVPNFIYISVIPDDFQSSESGLIYNYDPVELQALLNMQVGESISLRNDPTLDPYFTYIRLSDRAFWDQTAQSYENTQPWEFPPSTKEIRYYLKANGCTYLIGGYMATVGSGQTGAIDEELFDQVVATFRLVP